MNHRKTKFVQDACDTFSRRSFSRRLSRRFSKIPGVLKERLERYLEERLENMYLEMPIFKIHLQDTFQDAILKILFKTPFSRRQVSWNFFNVSWCDCMYLEKLFICLENFIVSWKYLSVLKLNCLYLENWWMCPEKIVHVSWNNKCLENR